MNGTLVGLWPTVAAARAAFLEALDGVSEADAARHPGGDEAEWGVLHVAQHVLGWTINVQEVIEQAARGVAVAKYPRGHLPADVPGTLAEVRAALVAASARFLALPERVPAVADEALTVRHEVYGDLNYAGWFARCAAHDDGHREQALAARRAL